MSIHNQIHIVAMDVPRCILTLPCIRVLFFCIVKETHETMGRCMFLPLISSFSLTLLVNAPGTLKSTQSTGLSRNKHQHCGVVVQKA